MSRQATAQEWAQAYIESTSLAFKMAPSARPTTWSEELPSVRLEKPGRPAEWTRTDRVKKLRKGLALKSPERRAELVQRFLGHELQAAELMAWAVLAFPDTPIAFRKGLLGIMDDEIRHMNHYADYLKALGFAEADFHARDWFWERIPAVTSPAAFCATMGMGFEGGNLDHASKFEAQLRAVGDLEGAALIQKVHREEVPHVRFAMTWFHRLSGETSFDAWRTHLPAPLSPWVMKGAPIDHAGRALAGFAPDFVRELEQWTMSST
jgi:uncharacterized ferritin-like protein (DUF455 family)